MVAVRFAIATAIALASAVLLAAERDLLAKAPPAALLDAAGWVVVVGGVYAAFDSAIQAQRRKRLADLKAKIARPLMAVMYEVRDATGIPFENLGVGVYQRRRAVMWWRGDRLECIDAQRRGLSPVRSGIRWRVGKGAIGLAVKSGKEVAVDLSDLERDFEALGDKGWGGLAAEDRLGLSADEMRLAKGKYQVVFASPVFAGSRVTGCIALDASGTTMAVLYTDAVRRLMSSAATDVSGMLES